MFDEMVFRVSRFAGLKVSGLSDRGLIFKTPRPAQRKKLACSFEPASVAFSRNKTTWANTVAEFLSEKGRENSPI